MNHNFYISLCRGLTGYYVLVQATDIDVVRRHVDAYYGKLTCNIYTDAYFHMLLKKRYSTKVINSTKPIVLNDRWEYE